MTPGSPLARLARAPWRFGFDAAVRLLMLRQRSEDPAGAIAFRASSGLAFPAAEVSEVKLEGETPRLSSPVMTLAGAMGVLPRYYTEALASALRQRSPAFAAFLDLLAQRLVGHFARAGIKYRPHRAVEAAALQRAASAGADTATRAPADPVAAVLFALTGFGTGHLRERVAAGTDPLLHYAGTFALRPRSADRLAALASDWLGRPVEVCQFAGAWLPLSRSEQTRLPTGARPGAHGRLGVDAAIGERAWDIQGRVVLRIGPLERGSFVALLPDREGLRQFVSLVRAYLGLETDFAVNLVLAAAAVPPLELSPAAEAPPRLGWNTWMPMPRGGTADAAEAVFEAAVVEAETLRVTKETPA